MATAYTNEAIIFIRNADKAAMEANCTTDFGAGLVAHFRVPCSATGQLPAQAWAARLVITPAMRTKIQNRAAELPQTRFYRLSTATGNLLGTNSSTASASVGSPWTFEQALADLGLQVIQEAVR